VFFSEHSVDAKEWQPRCRTARCQSLASTWVKCAAVSIVATVLRLLQLT